MDCTGYCRDCKIKHGIPVAGRGRAMPVRHVDPKSDEAAAAILEDDFIREMWELLPVEVRSAIMMEMWATLDKAQRVHALRQGAKAWKAPANAVMV
jgi:hypothetical protein